MREFIYYSKKSKTSGDLMEERADILLRIVINSFFVSYKVRENVKLHFIFCGPRDGPKHIEFVSVRRVPLREREFSLFLREILRGYCKGKRVEVFSGCFVEKKSLYELIDELKKDEKKIYILSKKGEDFTSVDIGDNCVFLLGEIPFKELRRLRNELKIFSLGKVEYFTSQAIGIVNYLLDRRVF